MNLKKTISQHQKSYAKWRQDIHAHPELAFEESRTSSFVAAQLKSYGVDVVEGLGKTGLVGTIKSGSSSKSIGLRADMDALPMDELNTFSYKSKYAGKMHGCGHDGHTVILLAAARYLSETKNFNGTVNFIFQPAEEANALGSGAKAMIEDGLFERFPMDCVFALHNGPGLEEGAVATRSGALMASMDIFEVTIQGQGTHGAIPHTGIDPLMIGSQLVVAWQSIVSRNVNAADSAVISATSMQTGDSFSVIPDSITLRGTVRTLSPESRLVIKERFCLLTEQLVQSFGASATISYREAYPTTVNDPSQMDFLCDVATSVVGKDKVISTMKPVMGSEDFAYMLEERPGCYFYLGNSAKTSEVDGKRTDAQEAAIDYGLGHLAIHGACMTHEPQYDFNDNIIPVGASIFVGLVERYLAK